MKTEICPYCGSPVKEYPEIKPRINPKQKELWEKHRIKK